MKKYIKSIWQISENPFKIAVIDQRYLPFEIRDFILNSSNDAIFAIKEMVVRGAPLIGVTAAWGMYLSVAEAIFLKRNVKYIENKASEFIATRPTAIDLQFCVLQVLNYVRAKNLNESLLEDVIALVKKIELDSENQCREIGLVGLTLIEKIFNEKKETVNILTHCNAGKLATVNYGTALAPVYLAHEKGIPVHVWVDETRPRMQGAYLTAFELDQSGVSHTIIVDNAGGHLMQHALVDMVITGADRLTVNGDAANKIGTYLKALAAFDNEIPFYVAVPSNTFDFNLSDGIKQIPVEYRNNEEIKLLKAYIGSQISDVAIMNVNSNVLNPSFDVTPARLITGIITERGICKATKKSLLNLFPEFEV